MDTIAALATPPGKGGVGIVRISGSLSKNIAQAILNKPLKPRVASYSSFLDASNDVLDMGIAIFFPGPQSFTGEDVLELHGHGGQFVLDLLLQRVLQLGARMANPGEFSERAFLNDKLDLVQAEAISDLINASSSAAARSAIHSLSGEFSKTIASFLQNLIHFRTYVESSIDFVEEEIDFLADAKVIMQLEALQREVENILKVAQQGVLLNEGINVVILGQPNVGKSTLLNQLSGRDSAIVTEIAGTTRDVLRENISIDGIPLHIADTAGLRDSAGIVEQEGIRRAWKEVEVADFIIYMIDGAVGFSAKDKCLIDQLPDNIAKLFLINKMDLLGDDVAQKPLNGSIETAIGISAKTGEGIAKLKNKIKLAVGYEHTGQSIFLARRRHLDALRRCEQALTKGRSYLHGVIAGELLAEELRIAQQALSEITGEFSNEDLLGHIFSSFCIGK